MKPHRSRPSPFAAVSTLDVAQAFGVSKEAIFAWKTQIDSATGIWREIKTGRGRAGISLQWDLSRVIEWRTDRAVTMAVDRVKAATPEAQAAAMTPLDLEQLRKLKSHNDERDKILVSRAELDRQWAKAGAELRQRLETLGRRHGPSVANDLARVMAELSRDMHGLLGHNPE